MTKTRYPDLEIYIKAPDLDLVADAIHVNFSVPSAGPKRRAYIRAWRQPAQGSSDGDPARQGL